MAQSTDLKMRQNAMFFRRIQVILIGVVAVSALEYSAKQSDLLQADRANQRIAKTPVQKKPSVQSVASSQAKTNAKPQAKAAVIRSIKSIPNQ
jgi:hypothetical protein